MKEITQEQYDYYLEVLPPLTMGLNETMIFLSTMDENDALIKEIEQLDVKGCFMQGEGHDNHEIYVRTKDGKFFMAGHTNKEWNTEMFRYNNWTTMTAEEIARYNLWR